MAEPDGAALAAAARSGVLPGRAVRGVAQEPDRPIHRTRGAKLEDRAPAVVGAVRSHAGVSRHVLRVRARSVASRAEREVAAAAAGVARPPDHPHGTRREGQAVSLRAVDSRQMDRAARAVHAGLLAPVASASSWCSAAGAPPPRSSTSTCWSLLMQLMNTGNMTAPHLEWVASQLDEWCAQLRLSLEPSSVTSFYVDLGAREGSAPAHARAAGRSGAVSRHASAALGADAERPDARAEDQGAAAVRIARRSAASNSALLTKLASQVDPEFKPFARRGERMAAAGTVDAIVGFAKISGFLREDEQIPIPHMESGTSFGGTMELAVFGRTRNEPDRRIELARRRFADVRGAGRPLGSQGREPDRLSTARADERRQRDHARDARRDPPARPDAVDARHRAPYEEDDRRPRRDRPAGDRQHADRRRSRRTAQEPRCRLLGGRRNDDDQRPHFPGPLSHAPEARRRIRPSNR